MIAIATDNGKLYGIFELDIPEGQNWSPGRIQRLMMEIERYVFTSELVDKDLPQHGCGVARKPTVTPQQSDNLKSTDLVGQSCSTLPSRKSNLKSGLVIDA